MEASKKPLKLTEGQQKAVDISGANVLVAAAAGSGKTKVLVDRILGKVTDKNAPMNVDEFLVVTFTNAAAAQMRDKIRVKLQDALDAYPESQHLKLQQLLVNRANICTIDSFCLKLVKENFNVLDIDSSFTISDQGMMELIKSDIMSKLFERLYDEEDEKFKLLVDIFGNKNQEEELKKVVSNIYYKASSYPVPGDWLDSASKSLLLTDEKQIDDLPWVKYFIDIARAELSDIKLKINEALGICEMPGGPDKYVTAISQDIDIIDDLINASTYEEFYERVPNSWPKLDGCKGDTYDKELIKKVQKIRKSYKDIVDKKIAPKKNSVELLEEITHISTYLVPLVGLTKTFMDEYMQEKKSRRMFEFSDIEHMAHSLVCEGYDSDGHPIPTNLARNISEGIKEIYIDEYQDSNYLQEDILTCISGNYRNEPNMFMVGDVKQSIYRFRMARPDLFIGKYNTFTDDGDNVKILLNNNFRSRAEVLLPVNYIFYQLMGADLGDIVYDETVSLVPTMKFPNPEDGIASHISNNSEIMLLNLESTEEDVDEFDDDMDSLKNLELEAHMIAGRIKELLDDSKGMYVYDEEVEGYRKASYRDIVILTRSMKGVGEQFYNVLSNYGIPVYVSDPKGYFDAVEVKVVMSLLSVIDNSKQDISLAAVLLSPIANINESQLAKICDYAKHKDVDDLYDKCQLYMLDIEDDISHRLNRFFDMLEKLKSMKNKVSISQLIWEALDMSGYYTYVSAMPMGHRRKANIDMLLEKADAYEAGYYKGLFNFLRYVDKLKVNQVDFGEAAVVGDDEDVVRIMTMHASKGLEYPIVFVSALGKRFNRSDYNEDLIINSDYYIAMKYMNCDKRYSKETYIREAFKEINKTEAMAEELRVLYVALTRAKEKLIITGHTKQYTSLMDKLSAIEEQEEILLPYSVRKKSQSFIELILATMVRFDILCKKYEVGDKIIFNVVNKSDLYSSVTSEHGKQALNISEFISKLEDKCDDTILEDIKSAFVYKYKYSKLADLKSKMSVSDIKKQKAYDGIGYDDSEFDYTLNSKEASAHDLSGATRGTIVHKAMELIDFASLDGIENLYEYALDYKRSLKDRGIFDEDELKAIDCKKIANMLASELGQRMIKAATRGELFKEQQFSIGFPVRQIYELDESDTTDDMVIVQGIVDGYFVEDGGIVVMDYKTDACDEDTLIGRYKAQLEYYADTLAKLRRLPIKEKIMYSFSMEKEVPV